MNKKTIFFTIILFIAFSISSWYALISAKKITLPHLLGPNSADAFLTNVSYLELDQEGAIRNFITATKVTHYPNNDASEFKQIQITLSSQNQSPWIITAPQGKSEHGKNKIFLTGGVNIRQQASATNSEMLVTTSALTIFPLQKQAETDQPITIQQAPNVIKAVGATADFNANTVKLLSHVVGEYREN
ncbi:MAG: LPS export ABC transporter periplasmic protein LptC [Gammaproteobacteria bacterium]|nr:LPS export ABC transporter periplasmic protein LptC [Gammaproteobacteria bacterium]